MHRQTWQQGKISITDGSLEDTWVGIQSSRNKMGPEYFQKSYQPRLFYVHKRERVSASEKAGSADKACRSEAGSLAKAAGSETGSSDRTGGSDTDSSWQASHTG